MPVQDFNGHTFVAFTDISGFKEMMKSEMRAVSALDHLNRAGYNQLQQHPEVNGFFSLIVAFFLSVTMAIAYNKN